ncbi:MAG: 4Fe-4S dicluster domain-containing protein [Deltaproteobacteria bacterium]|nr:4Fe-4S dicluster domain-containing protein [Deltaproteobacteria bacterium]
MGKSIADLVRLAGVVGAGGAGFPTHVKLAAKADTVIANGTECEPMLCADQHLMATEAATVLEGLRLAMQATGAKSGIVAVKRHYHDAVAAFERELGRHPGVRLHLFESFYPAGDEFIVVYDTTGRQVPEAGIPIEVGVVVQNVTTLYNVAHALRGTPVTDRLVTFAGELARPATVRIPIGTAFGDVLAELGGLRRAPLGPSRGGPIVLVEGGPMMGRVATPDDVVTKTTGGLLALPAAGPVVTMLSRPLAQVIRRGRSACDQCRDCTELCPRSLLGHELQPHAIMRSINYRVPLPARSVTAAVLCCECRLCEAFSCPLELSPCAYAKAIKRELREAGWKNEVHRRRDLRASCTRELRRVPVTRLRDRLGLAPYAQQTSPLLPERFEPRSVRIPLKMHLGAPARPVVVPGARVRCGEPVGAIPDGQLGAAVHASIDGIVRQVTDKLIHIERSD